MSDDYTRISEAEYKKLVFQLRGQFMAILNVFKCYGMDAYIDTAIVECTTVAENFGMALRGKKKPIHILDKPKPRAIE